MSSTSTFVRRLSRFRDSLFWLPLLATAAALALTLLVAAVDAAAPASDVVWLVAVTVDTRHALLGAVASSAGTVLAMGTSALVITVQLASSQYSPRVVRTFLRERLVRMTIASLLGLFVFALTSLASLPPDAGAAGAQEDVAVTVALLGSILGLILLVALIDRIAHAMEAGSVIQRVLDEMLAALEQRHADGHEGLAAHHDAAEPQHEPAVVTAPSNAWLVDVDRASLLEALTRSTVTLAVAPGRYCIADYPLLRVWTPDGSDRRTGTGGNGGARTELDEQLRDRLLHCVRFGATRDVRTDVAFGLRKLNDVILRALSPAVNDQGTAYEGLANLAAAVTALLRTEVRPQACVDDRDRVLLEPFARDHREFVHLAYEQVRHPVAGHPAMAVALLGTWRRMRTVLEREGHTAHLDLLDDQRDALLELVEQHDLAPTDLARVREAASLADSGDDPNDATEERSDAEQAS